MEAHAKTTHELREVRERGTDAALSGEQLAREARRAKAELRRALEFFLGGTDLDPELCTLSDLVDETLSRSGDLRMEVSRAEEAAAAAREGAGADAARMEEEAADRLQQATEAAAEASRALMAMTDERDQLCERFVHAWKQVHARAAPSPLRLAALAPSTAGEQAGEAPRIAGAPIPSIPALSDPSNEPATRSHSHMLSTCSLPPSVLLTTPPPPSPPPPCVCRRTLPRTCRPPRASWRRRSWPSACGRR